MHRSVIPFLVLICLAIGSCSRREADVLHVTSPLPSGIGPADTTLVLTFSKAIARGDSLNQYTETPFIEFAPPIQGKFSWADTSTLIFKPDAPFAGDTKNKGRVNAPFLTRLSGLG